MLSRQGTHRAAACLPTLYRLQYNANLFVMFNTTTNNATANQITSGLNSLSGLLASSTAAAGQFDSAQVSHRYSYHLMLKKAGAV